MPGADLSAAQARRIAVYAQGLAGRRPGARGARVDRRHFRGVVDTVGAVQIDSVNVITRAHELTFFARLGPYDRGALAAWLHDSGEVFEYWWHAACFIGVDLHPALRWKMARAYGGTSSQRLATMLADRPGYLEEVRAEVVARGPIRPVDLRDPGPRRRGTWWDWDPPKRALEALFWRGEVTPYRGRNFERWYDLPDRVLGHDVTERPTPTEDEGRRAVLARSARAMGVATVSDLASYSYMVKAAAAPLVRAMTPTAS